MTPGLKTMSEAQFKYMRDVVKPKEQRLQAVTMAANAAAAKVETLEAALKSAREVWKLDRIN